MSEKWASGLSLGLMIFGAASCSAFAGDALYGTVTKVKSADVVTVKSATQQYDIRINGIEIPPKVAKEAADFVSKLVVGKEKKVSAHLFRRTKGGEMLARLYAKDIQTGKIQDVGLELVRAGLAVRQKDYDYKYAELSLAESNAKEAKLGFWK